MNTQKMKTAIEYIKEAWEIYTKKENFIFFTRIMAVLVILTTSLGYLMTYIRSQNNDLLLILLGLLVAIVGFWVNSTTYVAILKMGGSEKEIFKLGFQKTWQFILISSVVGLIIFGGAILLIIPAIIFSVWYSFSIFLVLDKKFGIKESLRVSKQMVSGKFWKVLGRFIVFILLTFFVSILLTMIPYAGNIILSFIAPLFLLPSYLLYRDLSAGFKNLRAR